MSPPEGQHIILQQNGTPFSPMVFFNFCWKTAIKIS